MNQQEEDEGFTIISEEELDEANEDEIDEIEKTIELITCENEKLDLSERDISDVVTELRRLEEKLHLWREVRQTTILQLREIADYIDSVARNTGIAKVVGSSGGVLAGGLTLTGGVLTVLTAGAALPVLAAGAGSAWPVASLEPQPPSPRRSSPPNRCLGSSWP